MSVFKLFLDITQSTHTHTKLAFEKEKEKKKKKKTDDCIHVMYCMDNLTQAPEDMDDIKYTTHEKDTLLIGYQ